MDIYSITADIIRRIWEDITDRSGIGDEFDQLNEDIQLEIKTKWHELITDVLKLHG